MGFLPPKAVPSMWDQGGGIGFIYVGSETAGAVPFSWDREPDFGIIYVGRNNPLADAKGGVLKKTAPH